MPRGDCLAQLTCLRVAFAIRAVPLRGEGRSAFTMARAAGCLVVFTLFMRRLEGHRAFRRLGEESGMTDYAGVSFPLGMGGVIVRDIACLGRKH